MKYVSYALSYLPCLLLAFSAAMKFIGGAEFAKGMAQMGWPMRLAAPLGVLELACTALYLIPSTSILGAILLTGYLGGAVATHVRIGDAWIAPALLGVMLWGGLWLRDTRLKALIPVKK